MVAKYYRVQVSIPMDSGIPADTVVNHWAFMNETSAALLTDGSAIEDRLEAFYSGIGGLYSSRCDLSGAAIKIYDMTDPFPRLPFDDRGITVTGAATSGADLPPEVAMCLSFKKTPSSGDNARRRRGRVYLGPLQAGLGTASDDVHVQFDATVDLIANTAKNEILDENDDLVWAIYSESYHRNVPVGGDINARDEDGNRVYPEDEDLLAFSFAEVGVVWVDNAWDTQRRRGTAATYRKTLTA